MAEISKETQALLKKMAGITCTYEGLLIQVPIKGGTQINSKRAESVIAGAQPVIAQLAAHELDLQHLLVNGAAAKPVVGEGRYTGGK